MTPFLDFVNLLKQVTKLRKPVYSVDYWFITKDSKGWNSGIARWERCIGQAREKD